MQSQVHPLEPFFRLAVRNSYEGKMGIFDPEVSGYVAHLLCEFTDPETLYKLRDLDGNPIEGIEEMIQASDPIFGAALSFDVERAVRKHIGDYALFIAGMYPEAIESGRVGHRVSMGDLLQAGKHSYYIVSQFNLFEYEEEAPLFGRLSESFERWILGLSLVREELGQLRPPLQMPPHNRA
jgi:hypothetical protein